MIRENHSPPSDKSHTDSPKQNPPKQFQSLKKRVDLKITPKETEFDEEIKVPILIYRVIEKCYRWYKSLRKEAVDIDEDGGIVIPTPLWVLEAFKTFDYVIKLPKKRFNK